VVEIPSDPIEGKPRLDYDAEWLAILHSTNHLISVKENYYYLPGKKAGELTERFNFTPTEEELDAVTTKFQKLQVPENFERTVPAFDPAEQSNYKHMIVGQPKVHLNPQSNSFCAALGIDDPLCLVLLANGKDLPAVGCAETVAVEANDSTKVEPLEEDIGEPLVTPTKRKLNLSLPAPISAPADITDKNVIDLPEEVEPEETIAETEAPTEEEQASVPTSPNIKKLKRRNQNIYQAQDD